MHTHIVFYLGSQFLAAAGKLNVISFSFLFVLSIVHWKRPRVTVPTHCHNPYHTGRQEAIAQRKPGCLLSRTLPEIMPYSCGIAVGPCSPPGGDSLPAAPSKAFESLPAVVGAGVEAEWDPSEGCQLREASLGRRWGLSHAKAAHLPPELCYHLPPMTVTPAAEWRGRQGLAALASLARLERSPLVQKPRHQESALWGGEEVVSTFL